jgi:oligopeptidase B
MKLFFTLSRAGLLLLICIAFYIYNYVEYFQCLYKSDFKCLYEKDQASLLPPIAKRAESKFNIRNHSFVEHYNWMKTMSDDTKAYIKAENQYARHRISLKTEIRNSFVKKLEHWTKAAETERIQEFWETRTYVYFVDSNATYPRYLRRRKTSKCFTPSGIINTDEVVLDYNLIVPSSAKTFIHGFFEVSSDETLLAYAYDLEGNERFKLHIRNLTTLKELDILPVDTYYSARWHREDQTENLFFNRVNAEFGVPTEIYQICIIGCAHSRLESIKVYSEKDPSLTTELVKTNDCEFLFIKVGQSVEFQNHYLKCIALDCRSNYI